VRARIDVISEAPAAWRLAVRRWSRMNRAHKRIVDGHPAPSRNDEYLLYQTLVGTMPADGPDPGALEAYRERIAAYMVKAAREAKVHTSWISRNAEYEQAMTSFVAALLRVETPFFDDVAKLVPSFAWFGLLNSVSMTLLKLTQPGVPDIYQGCEMLDLSLVDPDNRRPVDFAARRRHLASLRELERARGERVAATARALFDSPYDGRAKLWVAVRALALRRTLDDVFTSGGYRPIDATGARANHVVAYARLHGRHGIVVIAGRLFASLALEPGVPPTGAAAWSDTTIDVGFIASGTRLRNALTDEIVAVENDRLPIARAFASFPAALFAYTLA
jgi:(1->4)-alpha-D-glucan 1-alpha-D-glucosylmutase